MKKRNNSKNILVFAQWKCIDEPFFMGTLHSEVVRGKEIFSFEYDDKWLNSKYSQLLDPDLQLYSGLQYLNDQQKSNFGIFLDSSPDRWGRLLMRRKEAITSRLEGRIEKTLCESDYLLGISDNQRMGAIRFKTDIELGFVNNESKMPTPPWTSIRELEELTIKIENEELINDPEYLNWLNILMAPGSSLGGARPKAGVLAPDNHLWIAKFPSSSDKSDIGGWEMVANELARMAGVNITEAMAKKFSHTNHTFLTKRFDRTNTGIRIHFASAMTMLGYTDGVDYSDGVSYLEIAEFLMQHGANVERDLEELWRRIVFNIAISNCDDHLRNHGFILTENGWILSQAYDINPSETGTGLKLNISENDNSLEFDLAMKVHTYFRIPEKEALKIIKKVKNAVCNWSAIADKYKISRGEQLLKAKAFKGSW